jgi:hypothetical protein
LTCSNDTIAKVYTTIRCVCLQSDTTIVKDTNPTTVSTTAPTTVPAQKTVHAKPEGWKGLGYWLATTDRQKVEDTLCAIRDEFMTKYAQPQFNSADAAQQNGQATGSWRQVRSHCCYLTGLLSSSSAACVAGHVQAWQVTVVPHWHLGEVAGGSGGLGVSLNTCPVLL